MKIVAGPLSLVGLQTVYRLQSRVLYRGATAGSLVVTSADELSQGATEDRKLTKTEGKHLEEYKFSSTKRR